MQDKLDQMGGILGPRPYQGAILQSQNYLAKVPIEGKGDQGSSYGYYVSEYEAVDTQDTDTQDSPSAQDAAPIQDTDTAPEKKPKKKSRASKKVLVAMSLDDNLPQEVRDYARQEGLNNQVVIERALEFVPLEEIAREIEPQDPPGGFPSTRRIRRDVKTRMLNVYLTQEQIDWIAEAVKKTGAGSRSHFISTALNLFFEAQY
jgi:hypothetical protein